MFRRIGQWKDEFQYSTKKTTCLDTSAAVHACDSLEQRRLCLYRPQMKSPHRSHHVGWALLQGWKSCPSPFSSVSCGSWALLRTRMMPTLLSRSGTFPGLILTALALSRREPADLVKCTCSRPDLRSRSSINSPQDITSFDCPDIAIKTHHNAIM